MHARRAASYLREAALPLSFRGSSVNRVSAGYARWNFLEENIQVHAADDRKV